MFLYNRMWQWRLVCWCQTINTSKVNEPILMQIGVNLPPGQGHERSTSGVRRSKIKVTGGRSYVWKPDGDIILDHLSRADRGMQWATEVLPLKRGAGCCASYNCTPRLSMCVLLTHWFNCLTSGWNCYIALSWVILYIWYSDERIKCTHRSLPTVYITHHRPVLYQLYNGPSMFAFLWSRKG